MWSAAALGALADGDVGTGDGDGDGDPEPDDDDPLASVIRAEAEENAVDWGWSGVSALDPEALLADRELMERVAEAAAHEHPEPNTRRQFSRPRSEAVPMPVGAHLHSVEIVHALQSSGVPPTARTAAPPPAAGGAAARRDLAAPRARPCAARGDDSRDGPPRRSYEGRRRPRHHRRTRPGAAPRTASAAPAGRAAPARRARAARRRSGRGGAQGAGHAAAARAHMHDALRDAQTAAQVLVVDKREAEAERAAQAAAAATQARRAAERAELEAQVAAKNAETAPKPTAAELAVAKAGSGWEPMPKRRRRRRRARRRRKMGRSGIFGRAAKAVEEAPAPAAAPTSDQVAGAAAMSLR